MVVREARNFFPLGQGVVGNIAAPACERRRQKHVTETVKQVFDWPIAGSLETVPKVFGGVRGGLEGLGEHFRARGGLRSRSLLGGSFVAAIAGLVLCCITGSEELLLFFGNLYTLFLLARGSGWWRYSGKIITLRAATWLTLALG